MHRYRNVIAKGVVVENIDGEEQYNVDEPAANWDSVGFEVERWASAVELGGETGDGDKDELHKSQQETWPQRNCVSAVAQLPIRK